MFVVIKAGAASVPCDSSHPRPRLQSVFEQVDTRFVLCCDSVEWMCLELLPHGQTIVVGERSGSELQYCPNPIQFLVESSLTIPFTYASRLERLEHLRAQ
jgi:non-ribosomal peptide synthetase component F